MQAPSKILFITLLALPHHVISQNAYSATLPPGISQFLPVCAQPCLKNSIEQQFSELTCSADPTLQCLCSNTSNAGDSLGKMAGACINLQIQAGVCTGVDAVPTARQNAFKVCNSVGTGASSVPTTGSGVGTSSVTSVGGTTLLTSTVPPKSTSAPTSSAGTPGTIGTGSPSSTSQSLASSTAPATSTSTDSVPRTPISTSTTSSLTPAAQAGIGIGATLGTLIVFLLGTIAFMLYRRRSRKAKTLSSPQLPEETYKRESLGLGLKMLELDSTSTLAEIGEPLPHEVEGDNFKRNSGRKPRRWSSWVRDLQGGGRVVEMDGTGVGRKSPKS